MAKPPEYQEILASNIRRLAESKNISLNKLADFAGVSRRHLYTILAGENDPTLGWIRQIADALEVDLLDLLKPPRR